MRKRLEKFFCFDCLAKRLTDRPLFYCTIMGCISLFEIIFIIHGFLNFDFNEGSSFGYMVSYFCVLTVSLVGIVLGLLSRKTASNYRCAYLVYSYFYCFVIFLFGMAISYFDYRDQRNTFVVFMTMTAMLPAVCLIDPLSYMGMTVAGTAVLLVCANHNRPIDVSLLANTLIYIFFANIIELSIYQGQYKNYNTEKELTRQAQVDKLTGLYNRRCLDEYMQEIAKDSLVRQFLFADLDKFKKVNDTRGHYYGDQVLSKTGELLLDHFGTHCYRYGGDEFIIILNQETTAEIEANVKAINDELRNYFNDEQLRISFGCYGSDPSKEKRYEDILIHADEALYETKRAGVELMFFEDVEGLIEKEVK